MSDCEESAKGEQHWFRQALDMLPKPLFLLDLDGRQVTYFNEAARRMLGLKFESSSFQPTDTYESRKYYSAYDPVTGEEVPTSDIPTSRLLRGEDVKGLEYRLVSSAGQFHVKVFSAKLPPTPGQPSTALMLFQDITDLKKTELKLRDTQENLNSAVEAAQIGFWHVDVANGNITLSPILLKQFGINAREFDFKFESALNCIHQDDRERVRNAINDALQRRSPYHISYRVKHRCGETVWIEANGTAIFDKFGQAIAFAGTTIDITAEIRARDLIQSSMDAVEHERNNFRSLFRQTPELACIHSGPDHLFVFSNDAHQRILGFDATGKTIREAQPDSVEIFPILDKVYQSGQTMSVSETPITVGGRLRYFNLTYSPRKDLFGRIDGVMVLGKEVTDEVISREAFQFQRQALHLALNDAPISEVLDVLVKMIERQTGSTLLASILLADESATHLMLGAAPHLPFEFNQAMNGLEIGPASCSCGTSAFNKSTVVTESIEDEPAWTKFWDLARKYELRSCWSTPIMTARGQLLGTVALYSSTKRRPSPLEEQIVVLAAQTTALILARKIEITERVASSAALKESESELNFTLDSAGMGTWRVDLQDNGRVVLSPKAREIFGTDQNHNNTDEAIQDFIHPDDRGHALDILNQTLRTGTPYADTYRIVKNGETRWVELRGRARFNESGKIWLLTGLVMDITDRKKAEEQLQQSKLEAERANLAKSQFLANMSHEIRTPLGAIMGFSSLLKDENLGSSEREEFLSVVDRNSTQLLRIIDDILDLSKVEAGMMRIENIDFSLIEMLKDFSALMGFKAREKGIVFTAKTKTPLPMTANTDPTRLRQILMNVVGNAIKFTDKGGVELRISFNKNLLTFEVEDTGRGISKDQEPHLFQPFTQADPSTTRKYGGTGLGLALSRKLAESMGGHFVLTRSQLGIGSTFSVTVSVTAPPDVQMIPGLGYEPNPAEGKSTFRQLTGMKILLVEDSQDNQALFTFYLNRAGATVDLASDGSQGYHMAMTNDYDLVLMDVQMPIMDGITTVKKLRADGYRKAVIALTAHAMKEERARCLEAGYSNFLSKPIQREDLINTLAGYK